MGPNLTLAAKSAANKESNNPHIAIRNGEYLCQVFSRSRDILRCRVDRQAIAFPLRNNGMRLHRVVMLYGCGVNLVDLNFGLPQRPVNITSTGVAGIFIVISRISI